MAKIKVTKSSGNVFADLGIPDAKGHIVKANLVASIQRIMTTEGMTQKGVAERVGVGQPDISKILHGHFHTFSVEKLFNMLNKLGCDVTISVEKAQTKLGKTKLGKMKVAA